MCVLAVVSYQPTFCGHNLHGYLTTGHSDYDGWATPSLSWTHQSTHCQGCHGLKAWTQVKKWLDLSASLVLMLCTTVHMFYLIFFRNTKLHKQKMLLASCNATIRWLTVKWSVVSQYHLAADFWHKSACLVLNLFGPGGDAFHRDGSWHLIEGTEMFSRFKMIH